MNLSSRWCVTAVVALGALACSDPVPPASQGAFIASVKSVSPAPAGKMCPSGAALTFDVPSVTEKDPTAVLTANNYAQKIIDGENSSKVRCTVKGKSTFTFSGRIEQGPKSLEITDGTIGADGKGTARIFLTDHQVPGGFSSTLAAPSANCTVDASMASGGGLQVKPGSMWAAFNCASVEAQPSDYCKADGFFVLENCSQ